MAFDPLPELPTIPDRWFGTHISFGPVAAGRTVLAQCAASDATMLTAIDNSNTGDTFRIKIWDKDNDDALVYDNQTTSEDDNYNGITISGGNIKVHKK